MYARAFELDSMTIMIFYQDNRYILDIQSFSWRLIPLHTSQFNERVLRKYYGMF